MTPRVVCAMLPLVAMCAAQAVVLDEIAESDVVIVGRVSPRAPTPVRLRIRSDRPDSPVDRPFAIYDLDVLAPIKGKLDATKIRVLAPSNRPEDYGGRGRDVTARQFSLPLGDRLVLLLQEKRNGEYIVERRGSRLAATSVPAPDDSDFAVTYLIQFRYHRFAIPPNAPSDFGLKGDYPGRDLARVFARSWRLPADPPRGIGATEGIWRLSLEPSAPLLLPLRPSYDPNAPLRALIGPDPLDFYVKEVLPLLGSPPPDAPSSELIARTVVAASWGDPEAAGRIADMALSPPEDVFETIVEVVGKLAQYAHGRDAAARLLSSPHPEIVMAALKQLGDTSVRSKYRDAVKALLSHEHPGVLCRAITALAFMDNETDRQATYGEDFALGSKNAEVLEYWRNKP